MAIRRALILGVAVALLAGCGGDGGGNAGAGVLRVDAIPDRTPGCLSFMIGDTASTVCPATPTPTP